jgi:hypothetical protein
MKKPLFETYSYLCSTSIDDQRRNKNVMADHYSIPRTYLLPTYMADWIPHTPRNKNGAIAPLILTPEFSINRTICHHIEADNHLMEMRVKQIKKDAR